MPRAMSLLKYMPGNDMVDIALYTLLLAVSSFFASLQITTTFLPLAIRPSGVSRV